MESRKVGDAAITRKGIAVGIEALACKSSKFNFGDIEPRAMFWGVVNCETISAGVLLVLVGKFCKEQRVYEC